MKAPTTDIHPIYLEVAPAEIAMIKFLFESYESVAVLRTLNRHIAVVVVLVAPDFLPAARAIIASIQDECGCREIAEPEIANDDWLLRELKSSGGQAAGSDSISVVAAGATAKK